MSHLKSYLMRTAALAILVGSLAAPVHAQDASDTAASPASGQESTTMTAKTQGDFTKSKGMMNVETRIKTLHDKLKITADQDAEWQAVAQTMRENEAEISQLIEARHQDPQSMTAVDDLQSYQKIAQAHADGLKKMSSSFEALYNDMSDDQKKNADQVFGSFEGHHGGKSMKHSKTK